MFPSGFDYQGQKSRSPELSIPDVRNRLHATRGARLLVLTHFSRRYPQVVAAEDLLRVTAPDASADRDGDGRPIRGSTEAKPPDHLIH